MVCMFMLFLVHLLEHDIFVFVFRRRFGPLAFLEQGSYLSE